MVSEGLEIGLVLFYGYIASTFIWMIYFLSADVAEQKRHDFNYLKRYDLENKLLVYLLCAALWPGWLVYIWIHSVSEVFKD